VTASVVTLPQSDRVLERLMRLHPKVIDLSLDRVLRLLERLGDPQHKLPPVVHVAGTNGKGSTIAYLRAILEDAGNAVHVYTSPHLVRFHERIRLAGRLIDEGALVALLEECEAANGPEPITFFEITTVAAFLAFTRTKADVVLLETGLGGRLDATNVVEHPAACCITSISMDHMQYLGETIEQIAAEKAGILKAGVPTVFGPQEPRVTAMLAQRAAESRAIVYRAGLEWQFSRSGDELIYNGEPYPQPALPGRHQYENAAVALAVTSLLERIVPDLDITAATRRAGLRKAEWPARLQRLRRGPLVEALPNDTELWLDGGHNAGAGQVLAQQLDDWAGSTHVIFGMLNTKQAEAFLKPLAARAASLQAVAIPGEINSFSAEEAAGKAPGAVARGSVLEAIESLPLLGTAQRVLICGSLYLAGRILAENG
jgi:dihydrofolate synthase/folylpolyglutamate synthase